MPSVLPNNRPILDDPLVDQLGPEMYWLLMDEFKKGIELKKLKVLAEVQSWSEAPARTSSGVDGMGHCTMDVPAEIYFDWAQAEGAGFWGDAASKRWFLNKNPQFKVKYQPKARTAWTPVLDRSRSGNLLLANSRTSTTTMRTAA